MSRKLAILFTLSLGLMLPTAPAAADATISTSGPLVTIMTSSDLNCAVNHVDDSAGEFYGDTACGTFVALDGVLYGPAHVPAGSSLGSYTPYTVVDQTSGGSGSVADPHRITTTVSLGDTGVQLRQVDTYVTGQASFRTDVTMTNNGSTARSGYIYRAADCYLANSDSGRGTTGADGRVGCTNNTRAEEFIPITGGSTFIEARYSEVWAAVGTGQALPNTCRCDEDIDNGMALAWNVTAVGGGSTVTVSSATNFGTSTIAAGQTPVVSSSIRPSTDEQGRQVFSMNRNHRQDLTISIRPVPQEGCTLQQVWLNHNGVSFPMSDPDGDGIWTGTIPADQVREGDITVTVVDSCGSITTSIGRIVLYDPSGIITDASTGAVITAAEVTLHHVPGWTPQTATNTGPQTCETVDTRGPDGWTQPAPTDQGVIAAVSSGTFSPDVNPQLTNDEGRYGWDVAEGCWYVSVTAEGYQAQTSPVVGVPPEVTDLDLALVPTGGGTPGQPAGLTRLQGPERIATSIAISQDQWAPGSAQVVVLARHDNYPDSLAGGPLAVRLGGPLLLTPSTGLWADTGVEIMRVLPTGRTVVLLGGVAALSEDVAMDLFDLGYQVVRYEGATRFETSVAIAQATNPSPTTVIIVDGNTFPDALIASGAAPTRNATMVLSAGSMLPSSVADYLDANNGATWIAIGPGAAQALPNADIHLVGADPYETSTMAADTFWSGPTGFAVASGENFPDGLAGSAHSGLLGYPLLLSPRAGMTTSVQSWLAAEGPFSAAVLYGGTAALSDTVASQAAAVLS